MAAEAPVETGLIRRLAALARLEPAPDETGRLADELRRILDLVAALGDETPAAAEAPAAGPPSPLRPDRVEPFPRPVLAGPTAEDGTIVVPPVLAGEG